MILKTNNLIAALVLFSVTLFSQENLRPLNSNINYFYRDLNSPKTVSSPNNQQRVAASLSLPFIDDFYYAQLYKFPDQSLWSDSSTYVNTGHGIAPMSIGVATFDGLNKKGYPYTPALVNMTQSLPADTLTSVAINLLTVGMQTLQPSDSVALTFYYQARGFGDTPETSDTFMVDLFKPKQNIWDSKVWFERGNASPNTNDTIFKRGFVWVADTAYLHDGFKFRFRNRATTAGDFDHWNLDYVYLNKGRSIIADTLYNDMTIGYVPSPLLKNYSAMPWRQYDNSEKAEKLNVFIRNNGKHIDNMTYMNVTYSNSIPTCTTNGGATDNGLPPFKTAGWSSFTNHSSPTYTCLPNQPFADSAELTVKHYVFYSGGGAPPTEFSKYNDTVVQVQHFKNYYAFDDGSAEAAYYVSGVGVKIAQKIKVNVTDTLRALKIYFDPIGNVNTTSTYEFSICVWGDVNGNPGLLMFQDQPSVPLYLQKGVNVSPEYTLSSQVILSPGTYYIGIQQKAANIQLGIGFDRNLDHKSSLYFDKGDGWEQSQIYGSLMMRPLIGPKTIVPVGLNEYAADREQNFLVYPNPANTELIIQSKKNEVSSYRLTNIMGQTIAEETTGLRQHTIHTGHLAGGVYFLTLISEGKPVQQQKIVVQH